MSVGFRGSFDSRIGLRIAVGLLETNSGPKCLVALFPGWLHGGESRERVPAYPSDSHRLNLSRT